MQTGAVALALSAIALGAAVFALTRESPQSQRAPVRMDRVAELEMQVEELSREVATLRAQRPATVRRERSGSLPATPGTEPDEFATPSDVPAEGDEALAAIVDDAVDRKTKKVLDDMRIKANKKPAMGVFASALELTKEQRAATERVVIEGQRRVHEILNIPTADGDNFMDELVEIVAQGFARPGKDPGFRQLFARIITEKIPGTNETFGARIESVKNDMRTAFKRDWTPAQYKEFEEWGVDPTEIDKVPGSPNEALAKRITQRARELGAEIPENTDEK
ncbi:MAG: hypothetical protein ACYTGZ_09545 [Planctomycetota bacterium]|jgi:hypothetical protein